MVAAGGGSVVAGGALVAGGADEVGAGSADVAGVREVVTAIRDGGMERGGGLPVVTGGIKVVGNCVVAGGIKVVSGVGEAVRETPVVVGGSVSDWQPASGAKTSEAASSPITILTGHFPMAEL